ncbi:hypothetical protein [Streptomyces sp. NPDC005141]
MKELIPVAAGFLLTTVLGGLLGSFFQQRTWAHQHRVETRERERDRAALVFEEVSKLLDKRLYRLRLLYWSLAADTGVRSERSERRMEDYRQVLYEWNDSINRNRWIAFRSHFGIESFYCRPGIEGAHEKGGVGGRSATSAATTSRPFPKSARSPS